MNLRQLLLILRLRWILVLIVALLVVTVTAVVNIRAPKVFTAQTSLLIENKADPLVATFMPAMATPVFLATQTHIIRSDRVAATVVKQMGLAQDKAALERWRQSTGGKIPLATYFSSMMQKGLVVEPATGTNVLNISFTASEPNFAAVVANTYAQAYIDFSVDLRIEPARQFATWFDQRAKELRVDLDEAKNRLAEAQQAKGIVSSDARSDEELSKLNVLETQLASANAERTELEVRSRNSNRESSPEVQANPVVQSLKSQLIKLEADFAEARGKYGEGHPVYQQTERQLQVTRQQLATEMQRVSVTSRTTTAMSEQKIADLQQQIEAQKRRVFGMRGNKDGIDILVKDVEAAQRAYDAVTQRRSQLNLESQSNQTGIRVLSVATEPLSPSKPKVLVNIIASVFVGLAVGAALACGIEFLDRRVRSVNDLKSIEGLPLLAVFDTHSGAGVLGMKTPQLPVFAKRFLIGHR